jgi:micrococcal nuclease
LRRFAVLLLVALPLVIGCAHEAGPHVSESAPAGAAIVVRPVDGDTIVVEVDGQRENVRLIGIDTPESVAQDRPVECFGPEAKARMAELLPAGTQVRLERDVEARDRYDRLLAYVIRDADDLFVNLVLVEEGYAEANDYRPNVARQAELDAAEDAARAEQRGLWPACGGTDAPVGPPPG